MKRIVYSLLVGIVPSAVLLVVLQSQLGKRTGHHAPTAGNTLPSPAPEERLPEVSDDLFERWKKTREKLQFLEGLNAPEAATLFKRSAADDSRDSQLLFDRWAELDPAGALKHAKKTIVPEKLPHLIESLVHRWAIDDPAGCKDWIRRFGVTLTDELRDEGILKRLQLAVGEARSEHPPTDDELAEVWRGLRNSPDRDGRRDHALTTKDGEAFSLYPLVNATKHAGNWQAAVEELLTIPDVYQDALMIMTQQWLVHDFEAATSWAESLPDGPEKNRVIDSMSDDTNDSLSLQFTDRNRLQNWQLTLGGDQVVGGFIRWSRIDIGSATAWLSSQASDTPQMDRMRQDLSRELTDSDNEAAIGWAQSIKDPHNRERALADVGKVWARSEPWAAVAWAQENLGWTRGQCRYRFALD